MAIAVRPRLFTVDEYHSMAEAQVFAPDERVELLDGKILTMAPIGAAHGGAVNRLTALFSRSLANKAIVQIQHTVRLSNASALQPDIALLRPREDFYSSRLATPADIFALVEVAASSLPYDRGLKLAAYARSGIVEYWIVNLDEQQLEIHRNPVGEYYEDRYTARRGSIVAFTAFPDEPLAVVDMLGKSSPQP